LQGAERSEQDRRVGIMTACVHHAGVSGAVRDIILLEDGQRIKIGAEGDGWSVYRRFF
jgi:hypothetical protein